MLRIHISVTDWFSSEIPIGGHARLCAVVSTMKDKAENYTGISSVSKPVTVIWIERPYRTYLAL